MVLVSKVRKKGQFDAGMSHFLSGIFRERTLLRNGGWRLILSLSKKYAPVILS